MAEVYRIVSDSLRRQNFVMDTIQSFVSEESDITLLCDDGTSLFTNKRFLGFFSPFLKDICYEIKGNDQTIISLPWSSKHVELLIDYLLLGEIIAQEETILRQVLSLLVALGIESNSDLIKPKPSSFTKIPTIDALKLEKTFKDPLEMEKISVRNDDQDENPDDPEIEIDKEFQKSFDVVPETWNNFQEMPVHEGLGVKCKFCSKECGSNAMLKQHLVKHTKEKNYECHECGKKFGTQAILYNHMGVHFPLVCEICHGKFAQKANFRKHKASMHQIYN